MEDVLTHVDDPNIVLETMTSRQTYLSVKRPEKNPSVKLCNNYSDFTRETFIDRMLESLQERGIVAKVAKDLNINYRTVLRWWKYYEETKEVAYKKFEENNGPKSSFTTEHNEKSMFEPEIRNSVGNLQTRFEWFMEWKDSDLDFIFIDEAGFHINMRNNWARSKSGSD
ncbi:hypothetical protein K501DRAFT_292896 [Backusella circina FSU 941]|nr:hypothetical protein K501DRAFT_292896 [Backusella circina FSU 941]